MRADFLPNLQMKVGILALQVISADFDRVDEGQILLRIAVVDSAFNLRYILLLKKLPHDATYLVVVQNFIAIQPFNHAWTTDAQ